MRNLKLKPVSSKLISRKIGVGTWKTAADPSVYGSIEIDYTDMLNYLSENYPNTKITPSHLIGFTVARCLKERPEINGMLRWSKIYLRDSVTLFYQVNIPGKKDKIGDATLGGVTIENAENLTVIELANALEDKVQKMRAGLDKDMTKNMNVFKWLPWSLSRLYLNIASFFIYGLNLNLSFLGLPRDPFGSVMITNVGGMGVDMAWAPLCPYTKVPFLVTVGAISDKPLAIGGEVKIRKVLPLGITFDHRLMDGVHAAHMANLFKQLFADPKLFFDKK